MELNPLAAAKACQLSYSLSQNPDDLSKIVDAIRKNGFNLISYDPSSIGALAIKDVASNITYVAYRGTDDLTAPSSLVLDIALGLHLGDPTQTGMTLTPMVADYSGFDRSSVSIALVSLLKQLQYHEKINLAAVQLLEQAVFRAVAFASVVASKFSPQEKNTLIICGHSLGGVFAQLVGNYLNYTYVTFNSPGAHTLREKVYTGFEMYEFCKNSPDTITFVCDLAINEDNIPKLGPRNNNLQTIGSCVNTNVHKNNLKTAVRETLYYIRQKLSDKFVSLGQQLEANLILDDSVDHLHAAKKRHMSASDSLDKATSLNYYVDAALDNIGSMFSSTPSAFGQCKKEFWESKQQLAAIELSQKSRKQQSKLFDALRTLNSIDWFATEFEGNKEEWETLQQPLSHTGLWSEFNDLFNKILNEPMVIRKSAHSIDCVVEILSMLRR